MTYEDFVKKKEKEEPARVSKFSKTLDAESNRDREHVFERGGRLRGVNVYVLL